jgi:hypothetical protein
MTTPSQDPEPLGGADAAPKTTYVVGRGTEPEERAATQPLVTKGAMTSLVVTALLMAGVLAMIMFR